MLALFYERALDELDWDDNDQLPHHECWLLIHSQMEVCLEQYVDEEDEQLCPYSKEDEAYDKNELKLLKEKILRCQQQGVDVFPK